MTNRIGLFHYAISYNMDLYRRCLEHCEALLQDDLKEWEKNLQETSGRIEDKNARDEYNAFMAMEYGERLEFQPILLNSFFAASYAPKLNQE